MTTTTAAAAPLPKSSPLKPSHTAPKKPTTKNPQPHKSSTTPMDSHKLEVGPHAPVSPVIHRPRSNSGKPTISSSSSTTAKKPSPLATKPNGKVIGMPASRSTAAKAVNPRLKKKTPLKTEEAPITPQAAISAARLRQLLNGAGPPSISGPNSVATPPAVGRTPGASAIALSPLKETTSSPSKALTTSSPNKALGHNDWQKAHLASAGGAGSVQGAADGRGFHAEANAAGTGLSGPGTRTDAGSAPHPSTCTTTANAAVLTDLDTTPHYDQAKPSLTVPSLSNGVVLAEEVAVQAELRYTPVTGREANNQQAGNPGVVSLQRQRQVSTAAVQVEPHDLSDVTPVLPVTPPTDLEAALQARIAAVNANKPNMPRAPIPEMSTAAVQSSSSPPPLTAHSSATHPRGNEQQQVFARPMPLPHTSNPQQPVATVGINPTPAAGSLSGSTQPQTSSPQFAVPSQPQMGGTQHAVQPQMAGTQYAVQPQMGSTQYAVQPQMGGTQYAVQPPMGSTQYAVQPQMGGTQYTVQPQMDGTQYAVQPQLGGTQYAVQPQMAGTQHAVQPQMGGTQYAVQPRMGGTQCAVQPQMGGTQCAVQPQMGSTQFAVQPQMGGVETANPAILHAKTQRTASGAVHAHNRQTAAGVNDVLSSDQQLSPDRDSEVHPGTEATPGNKGRVFMSAVSDLIPGPSVEQRRKAADQRMQLQRDLEEQIRQKKERDEKRKAAELRAQQKEEEELRLYQEMRRSKVKEEEAVRRSGATSQQGAEDRQQTDSPPTAAATPWPDDITPASRRKKPKYIIDASWLDDAAVRHSKADQPQAQHSRDPVAMKLNWDDVPVGQIRGDVMDADASRDDVPVRRSQRGVMEADASRDDVPVRRTQHGVMEADYTSRDAVVRRSESLPVVLPAYNSMRRQEYMGHAAEDNTLADPPPRTAQHDAFHLPAIKPARASEPCTPIATAPGTMMTSSREEVGMMLQLLQKEHAWMQKEFDQHMQTLDRLQTGLHPLYAPPPATKDPPHASELGLPRLWGIPNVLASPTNQSEGSPAASLCSESIFQPKHQHPAQSTTTQSQTSQSQTSRSQTTQSQTTQSQTTQSQTTQSHSLKQSKESARGTRQGQTSRDQKGRPAGGVVPSKKGDGLGVKGGKSKGAKGVGGGGGGSKLPHVSRVEAVEQGGQADAAVALEWEQDGTGPIEANGLLVHTIFLPVSQNFIPDSLSSPPKSTASTSSPPSQPSLSSPTPCWVDPTQDSLNSAACSLHTSMMDLPGTNPPAALSLSSPRPPPVIMLQPLGPADLCEGSCHVSRDFSEGDESQSQGEGRGVSVTQSVTSSRKPPPGKLENGSNGLLRTSLARGAGRKGTGPVGTARGRLSTTGKEDSILSRISSAKREDVDSIGASKRGVKGDSTVVKAKNVDSKGVRDQRAGGRVDDLSYGGKKAAGRKVGSAVADGNGGWR